MSVLKSYQCKEHGYFDAWEQKCAHCDAEPKQVFIKPFSIKSDRTKRADSSLKGLANQFKMTNIKSTREGEHQSGYYTRNNKEVSKQEQEFVAETAKGKEAAEGGVLWGGNGNLSMPSLMGGNAIKSVRGEPVGFNVQSENFTGPKPSSIMNDHQGLSLKDAK